MYSFLTPFLLNTLYRVKLAQDNRTGQFLAVKIIKRHHVEWLSLPTFQKILNNEVHLLQNIQHENIINLIDWNCQGELVINNSGRAVQIFFIVLELVEQGDLGLHSTHGF